MAKTAVVNPKRRRKATKRRRPRAHGAARRRRRRRRNAGPANPRPSRYSSTPAGYYRRPNRRKTNPSLMKMDTWTKVVPPATAGNLLVLWAMKMAGPFKPGAAGVPEPGIEHAIAAAIALQVGAPFIGKLLGGGNEKAATDYAQISGLGRTGEMFVTKRFMRDNVWLQQNIMLEGFSNTSQLGRTMTDATGNQYNYVEGQGWQLAGNANVSPTPGSYVQHPETGAVYSVLNGGEYQYEAPSMDAFYNGRTPNQSTARILEAPTEDLPGGATPSDMGRFEAHTPLGSHAADNSFGYAPTGS